MANCLNYNCAELPDYSETIASCGSKIRLSGASNLILIECGTNEISNPSSAAEINAALAAGWATLVSNIRIGFGDPSPISQDPITSCSTAITINYTRSIVSKDYKVVAENTAFWNAAKRRSFAQMIIFECGTDGLSDLVSFIDDEITVDSKRVFADSNDQAQYYDIVFNYKSYDDPAQYDAPVGVTGIDA